MLDRYISKKVRILRHFNNIVDDFTHILQVYATRDSMGVILSYEEHRAHADSRHENDLAQLSRQDTILRRAMEHTHFRHLAWIKSGIIVGTHFPVRFEKFVPLPENDYTQLKQDYSIVDIICQLGAIIILPSNSFVFVD